MKKLTPTIYVDKVFNIDFNQLKKNGIKMLCFDLDNTLDKPDRITPNVNHKLRDFISELEKDFEIMIVSNNKIKGRVGSFADLYNLNYIEAMGKPFKKKYSHENILKYPKEEVVFIGDKIITDVFGAKRLGYKCILVDPLYPKSKAWYNKVMSVLDKSLTPLTPVTRTKYFNRLDENEK